MKSARHSNAKMGLIRVLQRSLIAAVGFGSAMSWGHYFHAPLQDAQWEVEASQFRCELRQVILDYGVVRFVATYTDGLWFEVETKDKPTQQGKAHIAVRGPEWKSKVKARAIETVEFVRNERPVVVYGSTARELLAELSVGMSPTLEHPGLYSHHPVHVEILPVRLWPALRKFQSCQAALFEDTVLRAKHVNVHFEFDSYQLDSDSRQRLDKLIELLQLDPARYELVVRGHTDSHGDYPYNDRLSHKRALAVKTYLDLKNAPRSELELKYFGETKPLVPNDTDDNRLINRRVEVVLQERDEIQDSIEKAVAMIDKPARSETSNSAITPATKMADPASQAEVQVEPTLLGKPKDLSNGSSSHDTAAQLAEAEVAPEAIPSLQNSEVESVKSGTLKAIPYEESKGQSSEPIPGKIWAQ